MVKLYNENNDIFVVTDKSVIVHIGEAEKSTAWYWYVLLLIIFWPVAVALFVLNCFRKVYVVNVDGVAHKVDQAVFIKLMEIQGKNNQAMCRE